MTDLNVEEAIAEQEEGAETPALDADQQVALTLMEEVCASTGQEVRPVVRSVKGAYLHIELAGNDVRSTWGRMGASLDALQFLCNLIVARRVRSDVRIMLDADNYRERRAETLRQLALDVASRVKEGNEDAELGPLPAHERRIIHTALAEDPGIATYSEGEEPARRIVITPRR